MASIKVLFTPKLRNQPKRKKPGFWQSRRAYENELMLSNIQSRGAYENGRMLSNINIPERVKMINNQIDLTA